MELPGRWWVEETACEHSRLTQKENWLELKPGRTWSGHVIWRKEYFGPVRTGFSHPKLGIIHCFQILLQPTVWPSILRTLHEVDSLLLNCSQPRGGHRYFTTETATQHGKCWDPSNDLVKDGFSSPDWRPGESWNRSIEWCKSTQERSSFFQYCLDQIWKENNKNQVTR